MIRPRPEPWIVRHVERYVVTEYRNDDIVVGSRPLFEIADRCIANDIAEVLATAYDAKVTPCEDVP